MNEKYMQEDNKKITVETTEIDEFFTEYNKEVEENKVYEKTENKKKDYDFIPKNKNKEEKKPEAQKSGDLINELESSLVNFLTSRKDIEEVVAGGAKRVRSLNLDINVKESKPFFTVQIGVCEAAFSVENGNKEKGSCFGAERFIKNWFESGTVTTDMRKCVQLKLDEKKQD